MLIDPRDGAIFFYIGKGNRDRCFAHVREARKTNADAVDDYPKLRIIRGIESCGEAVQIEILRHGLGEKEALLVESAAIDLLGRAELLNRVRGHGVLQQGRMPVLEINAMYGAPAVEIDPSHRAALIRINRTFYPGISDEELYQATRKWWPVALVRREVGNWLAPEWAMAVYLGVVRAVYRIESWERPSASEIVEDRTRRRRWAFIGQRDRAMEALYLLRNVAKYTGASQFPVRYVNCQPLPELLSTATAPALPDARREPT